MPDETVPTPPEYADKSVMLRLEAPTASRATLRLHATAVGLRTTIDLTLPAADYLANALHTVATNAGADLDSSET